RPAGRLRYVRQMRFRVPVPEDAASVLALVVARDMVDLGAPDYTLEDLRDAWSRSDFDLAADAIVAETDDGAVVGYAVIEGPGTMAIVAPEHEGRGIGARLLEWSERRDRELGRSRHRQGAASGNMRARALLLGAGYEPSAELLAPGTSPRRLWRSERATGGSEAASVEPRLGRGGGARTERGELRRQRRLPPRELR